MRLGTRSLTVIVVATLLTTAIPLATASGGEDLRERNREALLGDLPRAPGSDVTASLVVDGDEQQVPAPEAIEALLDQLAQAGVDLGALTEPDAAGQGEFPLAGEIGFILESDSGSGFLPATCDRVRSHAVSQGVLAMLEPFEGSDDGALTSTLSEVTGGFATMSDQTGLLTDAVDGYQGAIIAGPNYSSVCVTFEFCDPFIGCLWFLGHFASVTAGAIDQGEHARAVHNANPLAPVPTLPP